MEVYGSEFICIQGFVDQKYKCGCCDGLSMFNKDSAPLIRDISSVGGKWMCMIVELKKGFGVKCVKGTYYGFAFLTKSCRRIYLLFCKLCVPLLLEE